MLIYTTYVNHNTFPPCQGRWVLFFLQKKQNSEGLSCRREKYEKKKSWSAVEWWHNTYSNVKTYSHMVNTVWRDGGLDSFDYVYNTRSGVRPAFLI